MPDNQVSDFKLKLDSDVEYYYLDIMYLKPYQTIDPGYYGFYVESYPDSFFAYWAGRGVVDGASGWQGVMWQIINGEKPIFYLGVSEDGYMLVDGLLYQLGVTPDQYLRVDGTYLKGTYGFAVTLDSNLIHIQMTFK